MDDAKQFYNYLPGKPIDELSEEFLGWVHLSDTSLITLPSDFYGLYNQNGKEGFSGVAKNSKWYQSFAYENSSNRAELWPYYSGNSHIVFWKGSGASVLDIVFQWVENSQTEFVGNDLNTGALYDISLHFNENNTRVCRFQ